LATASSRAIGTADAVELEAMRLRRPVLATMLVLALAPWGSAAPADAAPSGAQHLPDLRTLPPKDLKIDRSSGPRLLRLTNTVWNAGQGRLDLVASHSGTTTFATQRIFSHDAAGNWFVQSQRPAGEFVYHPEHNHWHFDDFAIYELRTVTANGGMGPVVRSSTKVSFCLVDTTKVNGTLSHAAPSQVYTVCSRAAGQGLSVGWGDVYLAGLPGQHIDITGLGNGDFWLVSTADPVNWLLESNETNNAATLKVRIKARSVTILPS
jgi:hypothetical protein